MRRILTWIDLLNKRLFKKPGFVAILLLVPLLTFAVTFANGQDSGVLKIALAAKGGGDAASKQMMTSLDLGPSLINFEIMADEASARQQVVSGKADAAWIFPADTASAIAAFLEDMDPDNAFITVVQREQTTMLALANEKLAEAVFPQVSDDIYLKFIRENVPHFDSTDDETLLSYYNNILSDIDLFNFGDVQSAEDSGGFLAQPIRGLLAVLVIISGLAAAVYFYKDEQVGTFGMLNISRRRFIASLSQQSAMFWVAAASVAALYLSGQWLGFVNELVCMAVYLAAAAAFCTLLRRLSGSDRILAALCPAVTVIFIAVCPIFFQHSALRALQLLLPTYYYLTAVYNPVYILYMALYAAVLWGVNALVARFTRKI